MEACNLDRGGVTKRLVAGVVALAAGLGTQLLRAGELATLHADASAR